MHRKFFTVLVLVVIFSMLSTGFALAKPDAPEHSLSAEQIYLKSQNASRIATPARPVQPQFGEDIIKAHAIALGKPGTTFAYDRTFGTTGVPYYDGNFLNGVPAIAIDGDDNVYAVEENGARLLKFAVNGTRLNKHGVAGMHDWGVADIAWPRDVVIGPDDKLWVADSDSVARFEPSDLSFINRFPEKPWETIPENRFHELRGIGFDHSNHLYLTDRWQNRIQVYNLGAGEPAYHATLSGEDLGFREPGQIIVDAADNLYFDDTQNARVLKCEPNDDYTSWTCETFYGGQWGSEEGQMIMPFGLGMASDGTIYMTDNGNGRVIKCADSGAGMECDILIPQPDEPALGWPTDVDVLSDGTILVSSYANYTIDRFSAAGEFLNIFTGNPGMPYATGVTNYNGPRAVDVDSTGSIYLAEEWGQRMIKINAAGTIQWLTGERGVSGDDDTHLSNPVALAVNTRRTAMIVAGGGSRVDWYNPANGARLPRPANFLGEWGEGEYQFKQAAGVAFDTVGNFYISDLEAQRVMAYNAKGEFVRQLGVTNEPGRANDHFATPTGLATDKLGNLYVADKDNCRVQKFDKKGNFMMTFGTTKCGWEVDRMGGPIDVAVDGSGRVYVAEEWNQRVKVFSPTGAVLAVIAGNYGDKNGDFRGLRGVAVDAKSSVYAVDQIGARIQKYNLNVPFAAKMTLDGFGLRENHSVFSLANFKNQLYAGTYVEKGNGAQIWRKTSTGWQAVVTDGFEDGSNVGIDHLYVYKGYLYASTYNCFDECSSSNGGQIWRSMDGETWEPVVMNGFDNSTNYDIFRMATLGGRLCASTWAVAGGAELWCSTSGDPDTWELEAGGGFGNAENSAIMAMIDFNGVQFVGTMNDTSDPEIFRRTATSPWAKVSIDFNDRGVRAVDAFTVFKTYLYMATNHLEGDGAQVWRCKLCDGSDWEQVGVNGFGDVNNQRMTSLAATSTTLYAAFANMETGLELWKTTDGIKWTKVSLDGLGSSNNNRFFWNNAMITVGSNLYLGTINQVNGGAVWKICGAASCK